MVNGSKEFTKDIRSASAYIKLSIIFMNPVCCDRSKLIKSTPQTQPYGYTKDSEELHGSLASLLPNGSNLRFYLFDLIHVAATLMVWDLCFQLGDFLGILLAEGDFLFDDLLVLAHGELIYCNFWRVCLKKFSSFCCEIVGSVVVVDELKSRPGSFERVSFDIQYIFNVAVRESGKIVLR